MTTEKLEPFYPLNKLCRELERSGFRLLREPPPFLAEEHSQPGDFVLYYFKNLTGVRVLVAVKFRSPTEETGYWSYYSNSVTVHWLKKIQADNGFDFIPCGVSNRHAFPHDRFSHFVEQLTARRPDTTEMENYNQYFEDVRQIKRRQIERLRQQEQDARRVATPAEELKRAEGDAYDAQRGYAPGVEAASADDLAADIEDMKKFVSRITDKK